MKRPLSLWAGLILLVGAAIVAWLWSGTRTPPWPPVEPLPVEPAGALRELPPGVLAVLPTLGTPIPPGKSAVWCASFQLAWERLKKDVTKGPVRLTGAEEAARRLNDAPSVADAASEGDVYAAAGFARDGIVAEIEREMARRFPDQVVADLATPPDGAVAYAYLRAAVKFVHPFLDNTSPLDFGAADGVKEAVRSFGLPYAKARRPEAQKQVEVLHASRRKLGRIEAFVLDLCKETSPYQVLVAHVPRQPTLAETLTDVEKRIAGPNDEELTRPLRYLDAMEIPHLRFGITHHFNELEGKAMPDQGMTLTTALQRIEFRLDAAGATLKSESVLLPKSDPRLFSADRPFLVLMRKRGATRPFFVLWVEDVKLLERWN